MARINGSVLGNLSGRLGNLSARTVQGETSLGARPSNVNVSQSAAAVSVRNKFAVTTSFAKAVRSVADLSAIWEKAKAPKLSAHNTIFRQNFGYSATDRPTDQNIITPGGFQLDVTNSAVAADSISIDLGALDAFADFTPEEVDLAAHVILCAYDPVDPEDDFYKLLPFSHTENNYDPSAVLNIALPMSNFQQNEVSRYNSTMILVAVASKDADGNIIQYSETYGA